MMPLLLNILANKHTTGAGVVYAASKFGIPVLQSWFPGHEAAFKTTAESLEGLAVFYGLAAAGDSSKSVANHEETKEALAALAQAVKTGNTEVLSKSDLTNPTTTQTTKVP